MRFTLIISLLLAVLAVIFALQNPEEITVALGPFEIYGSTALVLIITLALGVLVGILAMIPSKLKSRKQVKTLKKQAGPSPDLSAPVQEEYPLPDYSSYAPPQGPRRDA